MEDRLNKIIDALYKEKDITDSKFLSAAVSYLKNTAGDSKKQVIDCTYSSLVDAIKKSIELRIPIDSRGLAYIKGMRNKNSGKREASLALNYKAYFYKLAQILEGFDGEAFCVYEGDEFTTEDIDGFHTYRYVKKDVFASGKEKMKGVVVRLSYTNSGVKRQKLGMIGMEELMVIKSKSKTPHVWNEFFDERSKAAGIRRACKGTFDTVMGIQEMIQYENKEYQLEEGSDEDETIESIDKIVNESKYIDKQQAADIRLLIKETNSDEAAFLEWVGEKSIEEIPSDCYEIAIEALRKKLDS